MSADVRATLIAAADLLTDLLPGPAPIVGKLRDMVNELEDARALIDAQRAALRRRVILRAGEHVVRGGTIIGTVLYCDHGEPVRTVRVVRSFDEEG